MYFQGRVGEMKKRTRVTIKDIAKIANVSPQAVSLALRDAPDISAATKARINEIAEKLNYCKNATASNLRSGSTHLIAVVYDELKNFYYSIMIDFLQTALQRRGFSVLAFSCRYSFFTKATYLDVISHNVDGIISFLDPQDDIAAAVDAYHIPVLLFGRRAESDKIDCIYTDDVQGGRIAAKSFLDKGCKKPAFITVPDNVSCSQDRFKGFKEEFAKHGVSEIQVCRRDDNFGEQLHTLFKENTPDCIFCFNDMLAFEVLDAMANFGILAMPVIGYDDIQEQVHLPRRLTTIGTDKQNLVEQGADLMLSIIAEETSSRNEKILPVFLVKGTT